MTLFFHNFKKDLPPCYKLYADLPDCLSPLSTIPPHITSTLILCWFPQTPLYYWNSLLLLILIITFWLQKLVRRIANGSLLSNLQQAGYLVDLVTIEVGSLGHFMP